MAVGWQWEVTTVITVAGWLLSPLITLLMPKILSCLGFDPSHKLRELEIHIIPELKKTMRVVEEESMRRRGAKEVDHDVVTALDKMARMLRHIREEVEDIFDDQQEIESRRLYDAFETCIARCLWIARVVWCGSAQLMQWLRRSSLCRFLLHRSEKPIPLTSDIAAADEEPVPVTIDIAAFDDEPAVMNSSDVASDEPVPITTGAAASDEPVPVNAPSDSSGRCRSCLCIWINFSKNCCRFVSYWLVHVVDVARFYRDWSYEVVGIRSNQDNATAFDVVLTAVPRRNLKKRIEKVESTINEVKKYLLLGIASKSAPNDMANKNRSRIRTASNRKVFGRAELRDNIMAKLRETPPSLGASQCYSVIGIYGVAGSGKTTFARYTQDYIEEECKEEKLFDTIMCIHLSETFNVDDIFHEMLKDITRDRHSSISDREELEEKLKESLSGKRFFLILDDLWVKTKNDPQLEELISLLNVGMKGSKILVTARTKVAARALTNDEPIEMPDLDEDLYFSMFLHYALGGASVFDEEFIRVGRVIAEKLHRSPIAAVAVAGRLGTNLDIKFWKNTTNHGMLNDTMDALWWSYRSLDLEIRRCFEFCNIFPRRSKLSRGELVRLWIAQGFVKNSCATEYMEGVAEGYIQELVSCSFLQPQVDDYSTEYFTIHDLLHDLLAKVVGSDCFRIENTTSQRREGWKGEVPRDVRHLFMQNYDGELITEMILGLQNLRTLIIYVVEEGTPVEGEIMEGICKRLPKLRVLSITFSQRNVIMQLNKFLVPESICQLKHLRYLAFRTSYSRTVILPSSLTKLQHIELLDFGNGRISEFPVDDLINMRHIICGDMKCPNIGRLISLQTIPKFTIRNEQGYEIKQLRDLNKLDGDLEIYGLENVKSKKEALEANLGAKERLTKLILEWGGDDDTRCGPEVEAKVLEGLCPPAGLQTLHIWGYQGSTYPDWMVGKQNGGPKDLQELCFWECSQLGPGPEFEAFPRIRVLWLACCSWDTLPGNMEHLTSLKVLRIMCCFNIRSLPTLPQSLEEFLLGHCGDELMKSCQTVGHPNWQKIEHVPKKIIMARPFQVS